MKAKIDWQKHIKDWQASGLSKAEYCRQNRV
ncbi:IS66 family insertion sequence element accessory protein TnpA, partial [Leptonema illini]